MDTDMEYVPINIKQEASIEPPTSASDANENSSNNNNQAAPDSVEPDKVSGSVSELIKEKAAWEAFM